MLKISIIVYFIFLILEKPCVLDARSNKKTAVLKYGPYVVMTRAIEMCNTSIDINNSEHFTIKVMKLSRTREHYVGNVTILNDTKLTSISIAIDIISGGRLVPELKRKIENPCNNVAFTFILNKLLKADLKCIVKKGTYEIKNINMDECAHLLYSNFIYNQYVITMEWSSDKLSLLCIKLMLDVKPLKTNQTS